MRKSSLLLMAVLAIGLNAHAADGDQFTIDNLKYKVLSEINHDVALVGYETNLEGNLIIPAYVKYKEENYFITEIGDWAFDYCSSLTSVTIPNSVTKIDDKAFYGCSGLTSITIPNSVTEIGIMAFSYCESLKEILVSEENLEYTSIDGVLFNKNKTTIIQYPGDKEGNYEIPNSVTSIGNYAFSNCSGLTSITIPNSVTGIGNDAFFFCSSLTSLTIPNSVTKIGDNAFHACISLASVTIPNSVTEIGETAFRACISLASVTIPNSVTEIGDGAFSDCCSLTSTTIPNSVTKIGKFAFSYCWSLTSVAIPNSVTEISDGAFLDCSGLTSVTIPNSVTEISNGAFSGCSGLTSVTIPNSIIKIDIRAFAYCSGLKSIYALPTTPPETDSTCFEDTPDNVIVYIPKGTHREYVVATGWDYFYDFRELPGVNVALSKSTLLMANGETASVTATVTKDDGATIEYESWASSDPEVATVDNGEITAHATGEVIITYTLVDSYGISYTAQCDVTVSNSAGIESVEANDINSPAEYFNLNGVSVDANALSPGFYIKRQTGKATKVLVK